MRMEKINEHQIRCTLTAQDLSARKLSLRDLKYGSSETMDLFRDIVSRVSAEFSFNSEQLPLMIEAIPLPEESLLLIISAIEDAEELDAHFAQFAADAQTSLPDADNGQETFYEPDRAERIQLEVCMVRFGAIDEVIEFARKLGPSFRGESELYLDSSHTYYLALLKPEAMETRAFLAFLNSIMEYGDLVEGSAIRYAYLKEHEEPVMKDPLRTLSAL